MFGDDNKCIQLDHEVVLDRMLSHPPQPASGFAFSIYDNEAGISMLAICSDPSTMIQNFVTAWVALHPQEAVFTTFGLMFPLNESVDHNQLRSTAAELAGQDMDVQSLELFTRFGLEPRLMGQVATYDATIEDFCLTSVPISRDDEGNLFWSDEREKAQFTLSDDMDSIQDKGGLLYLVAVARKLARERDEAMGPLGVDFLNANAFEKYAAVACHLEDEGGMRVFLGATEAWNDQAMEFLVERTAESLLRALGGPSDFDAEQN